MAGDDRVRAVDGVEGGRDRLADRDPGALGAATGRACPPAEPGDRGHLRQQGLPFGSQLSTAYGVPGDVRLVELGVDPA